MKTKREELLKKRILQNHAKKMAKLKKDLEIFVGVKIKHVMVKIKPNKCLTK